jgi:hypothetical protein
MKKLALFLLTALFLNSCASILNEKTTLVKISADKKSEIIFKNDTLSISEKQVIIQPNRSKKPLRITVLGDSLSEDFFLERKVSNLFWLNIFNNLGIGMLIDLKNNKRFTYKRNLYFVTDTISKKTTISNKKIALLPKKNFFLYTSPLEALDFFSIPMVTLGTEYFVQNNFSVSAEFGTKIVDNHRKRNDVEILEDKAINYRLETKWYNKINFTGNVHLNEYLALEFRQIKSQYNDKLDYGFSGGLDRINSIKDDFATKKKVTIINLKYGQLVPISNRLYFDIYVGLGLRLKSFKDINLDFDREIHTIYDEDDFPAFNIKDFQDFYKNPHINITAGFKLGFKL